MSITVRLIFWGLVGFASNQEGHKGITALLVDPDQAQAESAEQECVVPTHLSAVYLFNGQCEGDCQRIPQGRIGDAQVMALDQPLHGRPLPLAWLLDREDLDISGDEKQRLKLRKPWLSFGRKVAPKSERQGAYFSWVQSTQMLTGQRGRLSDACVEGNEGCPIQARFKIQGGKAGACHLYHLPEPQGSTDSQRSVQLFGYTGLKKSFQRAVADAMLVEFKVEGDRVTLLSRALPGKPQPAARANLRPDRDGKLTIVIANFPRQFGHSEMHNHEGFQGCAVTHSDVLFDLLATKPRSRAIRKESSTTLRATPGSCEPEAIEFAELLATAHPEAVHAATACDGLTIP